MRLRVGNIQYGQILVSEVPAKPMFDWTCRDRALRVGCSTIPRHPKYPSQIADEKLSEI